MTAFTTAVERWRETGATGVLSWAELRAAGVSSSMRAAYVRARRWQRIGIATVLHNHELTRVEREHVALINCGPRSLLTSFTGAARWGLSGWDRPEIHVLVPVGTRRPPLPGVVLHRVVEWGTVDCVRQRRLHRLAPALVVAAGSVAGPRVACGLLAAAVQQRLTTVAMLSTSLELQPKLRHLHALRLALYDIEQGAQALTEIDFAALCRRNRLPAPLRQGVRVEQSGRRRYLDAQWRRRDGRLLAAEVDGAIHLKPLTWVDDQLRQNELVLAGTAVLRFPSVVIRSDEHIVADQLRRGLELR